MQQQYYYPPPPPGFREQQKEGEASANGAYPQTGPQTGYPQTGYPQTGYPQAGYPLTGYPQTGYPQTGYPQTGYPQASYPQAGYPQTGYPQLRTEPGPQLRVELVRIPSRGPECARRCGNECPECDYCCCGQSGKLRGLCRSDPGMGARFTYGFICFVPVRDYPPLILVAATQLRVP